MDEPIQVGLSNEGHDKLSRLKEEGHFEDMADGYRFAVALALAHGFVPDSSPRGGPTMFNIGSLDPDRTLYAAIRALAHPTKEPVYKCAEKLAEWGVEELTRMAKDGKIPFAELLDQAESLLAGPREA